MPPEPRAPAYFDTSVLARRYLIEQGSERARGLLRRHRVISSALAPVELTSALSRRRTSGELTPDDLEDILNQIEADRRYWNLVEVTAGVLDRAEVVIRQTGVRTLDAIHLASALQLQSLSGVAGFLVPFVTGDAVQREAAAHVGLEVQWVG